MKIILIVVGVLAVVAISVWLQKLHDAGLRRLAKEFMGNRPRRSSREFGQTFYPDHAEVAATVRDILAQHHPIDLAQLEPSDQPVADLKMDDLDSMSTVEFVIAVEKHFGITIKDADAEKMRTFDDICTHVIAKLKEKEVDNNSVEHIHA
ncbi:MAG TPA: acyl carrier protein [bacterium]|nr:acyl carrier protein [bacterium]